MRSIIVLVLLAGCSRSHAIAAPVALLAEARASHSATLLVDGTILIAGGFRKAGDGYRQLYSNTTELFDPASDRVVHDPSCAARAADMRARRYATARSS